MIWKTIPGFSKYEISEAGNIRRRSDHLPIKSPLNEHGYFRAQLSDDNDKRCQRLVHRLLLLTFVGEPPTEKHVGAHDDGCRTNNALSNLRWATVRENHDDMDKHKTRAVGSSHGRAKLTDDQVREIRASNLSNMKLESIFNLSNVAISKIKRRVSYPHVN